MPIYGLFNCTTEKRSIYIVGIDHACHLPCGVYKFAYWPHAYQSPVRRMDLECRECKGSGIAGEEEISGGHKKEKECEACFGSGVDPLLLKKFKSHYGYWGGTWTPHGKMSARGSSCENCDELMRAHHHVWPERPMDPGEIDRVFMLPPECKKCKGSGSGNQQISWRSALWWKECDKCLGSGLA